jgi:anamorsin
MESIEATLRSSEQLSPETLSAFFDALKPGGRLGVFVKGGGEQDSSSAMMQKEVSKRLTLEGFEDVVVSEQTSVSGTSATKVSGRKPKWERGVTFSLGEKKTKKTLVSKASAWEEDDDDRDEMIDEDALLTEKDKAKPNAEGEGVGCPPTRKPCKDCTCGRKEEEEMKENATPASSVVKMDLENDPNDETFKSACGNCALGDAFRCAGCPYLGQPAFKENDEENKVVMLDDLGTVDL